ncbi:MAG TPA: haloacid dehalogenase type II [Burkholderiales bacterium]|nr:haloacid dehalogenase type II [Burkholderiales bacterium]
MTVDALVFDAYGTLYDVHSVMRRCESCFPGKGAQLSQLWRAKQLEYTWQRSLMQRYVPFSTVTREALAYSCAALQLDLSVQLMEALMSEYLALAPFPEVPDALGRLSMKKAILSNGSPDILEPLVRQSGLRFDAVISVDELKIYKPAPQVYELAVRRLDTPKERIGFVSSNCWDALGARSYGFRVYWINRAGAPVDRLGFMPDAQLQTLAELSDEVLR